jgi:hypothetical protein
MLLLFLLLSTLLLPQYFCAFGSGYRVPAVACVADVADITAFAGFPTVGEFPTGYGIPVLILSGSLLLASESGTIN